MTAADVVREPLAPRPPRLAGRRAASWSRFVLRKLLHALVVVLLAYSLSFFLLFILPGDAILARIGLEAVGTADLSTLELDGLREEVGLGDPIYQQYVRGLIGLFTGDLGRSMLNGRPVIDLLLETMPNTLTLAGVSILLAIPLGFVLAIAAVYSRTRWVSSLLSLLPSAYVSLPIFWIGIVAIYVFSFTLGWLPASGSRGLASIVMPATVLALGGAAQFAQVLIASLREELETTYASTTAPAKGATRFGVLVRHCLRNASFPFLTVLGLRVGTLLGGTVIVEMVFTRAGLGRLMVDSVQSVDLTVVLGVVVVIAVAYVVINALVDFGYLLLDPRLRRRAEVRGKPEVAT